MKGAGQIVMTSQSVHKSAPKWSMCPRARGKEAGSTAPGPGAYGFTAPDKDKFSRTPSFGFGTSSRDGKSFRGIPGPGAYTPLDPRFQSTKVAIGSEPRLGAIRRSQTPGPGTYDTRGNMEGLQKSFSARLDGGAMGKRSNTPAPGNYNVAHSQTEETTARWGFGTSSRPELLGPSKSPGPGTYEYMTALGGSAVTANCPKYTLKPRRNPLKSTETPGPAAPYTQFA